jgi:hypothetical protein
MASAGLIPASISGGMVVKFRADFELPFGSVDRQLGAFQMPTQQPIPYSQDCRTGGR